MKKQDPVKIDVDEITNLSTYAYIKLKAQIFLKEKYVVYSEGDAFKQPGKKLSSEVILILTSGCEQIRDKKGLSKENPFEGLGIKGFYTLMSMFHFRPLQQQTSLIGDDFIIDKITFQHHVLGKMQRIVLFNKVITE